MKVSAIAFAALIAIPASAAEAPKAPAPTVQEFLDVCKAAFKDQPTDLEQVQNFQCISYVGATRDMLQLNGTILKSAKSSEVKDALRPFALCGSPTYGAAVKIFTNWANAHPEQWDKKQLFGVITALTEKFPCP